MGSEALLEKLKDSVIELGTRAVMSYLCVQFPFLNVPILKWIAGLVVGKVLTVAVKYTELGIYFIHVDVMTSQQAKHFEEAAGKLEKARTDGKTPEEIKALEEECIDRARELIRFGRVRNPA
jgi:hypothetical protein